MPMTLRSAGRDTVPMMGPRPRAASAPQAIGNRGLAPGAGWEVSRIWSVRFGRVIACPKKPMARRDGGPHRQSCLVIGRAPARGTEHAYRANIIALPQPETMASTPAECRSAGANVAVHPTELNIPGFGFHALTGDRKETYSVWVTGNWRVTFKWDDDGPFAVNLEDYHGK